MSKQIAGLRDGLLKWRKVFGKKSCKKPRIVRFRTHHERTEFARLALQVRWYNVQSVRLSCGYFRLHSRDIWRQIQKRCQSKYKIGILKRVGQRLQVGEVCWNGVILPFRYTDYK